MRKGGTGKSTTAVSVGAELALRGFRVRVWDLDAQMGSTTHWLALPEQQEPGEHKDLRHLFLDDEVTAEQVTYPTKVENLYLVPSYTTLAQVEMSPPPGIEQVIDWAIANSREGFDVEIADCGPSLGQLTIAGLYAAPNVIIPVKASGFDRRAVDETNQTLATVKRRLRPELRVVAVLMSELLKANYTEAVFDLLCDTYPGALVMGVRQSVKVREASDATIREPLHVYAEDSTARQDFRYLAARLLPEGKA